jgi:hypothetical protein
VNKIAICDSKEIAGKMEPLYPPVSSERGMKPHFQNFDIVTDLLKAFQGSGSVKSF